MMKEGERADVYSLQKDPLEDLSIIAKVESDLVVKPRIMMPGITFVHPDEMIKLTFEKALPSKIEVLPQVPAQTSVQVPVQIPAQVPVQAPVQSVKTAPKTAKKNVAPVKKPKVNPFTSKKPTVDLKAKLQSPMFHTEKDNVSTSEDDDQNVDNMPKSTDQQFVTFSSEEEVEPNSPMLEETLDSPMEIDQGDGSSQIPTTTISSGPKMKMIKVPRTFMENGYLMTEMVTEMVPNEDDENSSSPEPAQQVTTSPKGSIKPVIPTKKQGNLLSFFKPKQLN